MSTRITPEFLYEAGKHFAELSQKDLKEGEDWTYERMTDNPYVDGNLEQPAQVVILW